MSNKIEFEDKTTQSKEEESKKFISLLAAILLDYTCRISNTYRITSKESATALYSSYHYFSRGMISLGHLKEEDISEIEDMAIKLSEEKLNKLKESGIEDIAKGIKEVLEKIKKKD